MRENADPQSRDKSGLSAIDLAKDQQLLQLLLNKQTDDPTDLLTSGVLTPNSEQNSFSASAIEAAEPPMLFSTFGVDNLKPDFNHKKVEPKVRKDFELKPLYNWLRRVNIPQVYDLLVEAGYDDIDSMVHQMVSPLPITLERLRKIGITKPGHRRKLILRLQEEAGIIPRRTVRKTNAGSMLQCCIAPNNATIGFCPSLFDWLESMDLARLHERFEDAGFDDYEVLVCLMLTDAPISEEILGTEVGVTEAKQKNLILKRLKKDAQSAVSEKSILMFDEPKNAACELCILM